MIKEDDIIPILKDLIKYKTESPYEHTIEAIEYIASIFNKMDIKYEIQEYRDGYANLIAEYGENSKSIILTGHIDVVSAGKLEQWLYPPFVGEEQNGKIYGRGTTDMKGAVAARARNY